MTTLTGRETRTISGYAVTLLEYPRWVIEREVDFTDCEYGGNFKAESQRCVSCLFGGACRWLNASSAAPTLDTPLDDLVRALRSAVEFLGSGSRDEASHPQDCECDTCLWLHDARGLLRTHRRRT